MRSVWWGFVSELFFSFRSFSLAKIESTGRTRVVMMDVGVEVNGLTVALFGEEEVGFAGG